MDSVHAWCVVSNVVLSALGVGHAFKETRCLPLLKGHTLVDHTVFDGKWWLQKTAGGATGMAPVAGHQLHSHQRPACQCRQPSRRTVADKGVRSWLPSACSRTVAGHRAEAYKLLVQGQWPPPVLPCRRLNCFQCPAKHNSRSQLRHMQDELCQDLICLLA